MKSIGKIFGIGIFIIAGILMLVFWFLAMTKWLGFVGSILALILTPGIVIFPIVYWIVEGVFPIIYFIIWGIGWLGVFIASVCDD